MFPYKNENEKKLPYNFHLVSESKNYQFKTFLVSVYKNQMPNYM